MTLSATTLSGVPHRHSRKDVIVLKFGGTTLGAERESGRIRLARQTITGHLEDGHFVVPVFSAYRRGRGGSASKFSMTDLLHNYAQYVARHDSASDGVEHFGTLIQDTHLQLAQDLELLDDDSLRDAIESEVAALKNTVALAFSAYESTPSLNDVIVTAGERLAVRIMAAYLNRKYREGKFPIEAAPVTALELGLYTNKEFGAATIDWARATDHTREVIFGQYLEKNVLPVVSGFDGIYDPHNEFPEIMQTNPEEQEQLDQHYARVYRTSLGRGGSDLTATFLGMALGAEFVGFCKETPGVLTGDDMLVGDAARTIPKLDYELATEAGNIYSRAVEPVRAANVPVHIFDPARPEQKTVVLDIDLPDGLYIIERPVETVNLHVTNIPDEPGALGSFLQVFAEFDINVEEVRHQRSGTDCVVRGSTSDLEKAIRQFNTQGLRPRAHFTWFIRVVGNITEDLSAEFNEFLRPEEPLTLSGFQVGTKVLTASIARNRAGSQEDESQRVEAIARRIHAQLIAARHEPSHEQLVSASTPT